MLRKVGGVGSGSNWIQKVFFFCLNAEGLFFLLIYSDIHTTKHSGGHKTFAKMIKNAGSGWQLLELISLSSPLFHPLYSFHADIINSLFHNCSLFSFSPRLQAVERLIYVFLVEAGHIAVHLLVVIPYVSLCAAIGHGPKPEWRILVLRFLELKVRISTS